MKRLHSEAVDVSPADVASMAQRRAAILSRMGDTNGPVDCFTMESFHATTTVLIYIPAKRCLENSLI